MIQQVGVQAKFDAVNAQIDSINERLAEGGKKIAALREQARGLENFEEYESHHSEGIDLARLRYSEMRKLRSDLQLIFQDPYSSLNPRMTVGQIIGEGMIAHKFFRKNDEPITAAADPVAAYERCVAEFVG